MIDPDDIRDAMIVAAGVCILFGVVVGLLINKVF